MADDQSAVADFLADPAHYGGGEVRRIDTHGAMVFIGARRVLKLKRAVRFAYMDFSTVERRRAACAAEVRLNRRTAPFYRAALPVTRDADGRLALGGEGPAIDWVVDMERFDDDLLFDRLAGASRLDEALLDALAAVVAGFHESAEVAPGFGGAAAIGRTVAGNLAELRRFPGLFEPARVADLERSAQTALAAAGGLLDRRRAAGAVRRCHGDLHLRNICLYEGRPTLFDAIEFSDDFACIDVVYDLAFLLMDLWYRDLRPAANLVLNRYLWRRPDYEGLAALPLFLSCRAGVRAHVSATGAAAQPDEAGRGRMEADARRYFEAARRFLDPAPPVLVAVGGLSGSGKSSLARAIACELGPPPGAVVLQSDAIRKRLSGIAPEERLPAAAYSAEAAGRTYGALRDEAARVLATGSAVVADAVHARPAERAAIAETARRAGVPFVGLWLEAPVDTMAGRITGRRGDVSDATPAVLEAQRRYNLGEIAWTRIAAGADLDAVVATARAALSSLPRTIGG